ncbi:MAG TPA: universal stress protein [Acidimicrobiales bacterium]|nr:universal stress protein [Acidimicrobiales bacterium]
MFESILTAVDGSEHDSKALAATKELAKLAEGTVRVVHVREGDFVGRAGFMAREEPGEASKLLDETVAELVEAGVKATGTVRSSLVNLVALEILEEAEECGASVIVMGSRGVSDLKGLLVGSTTHKVLHLGQLPVVVVR